MKTPKVMFTSLFTFLQEKPQYGMTGTAGGFALGASPTLFNLSLGDITPWLQMAAFFVTIIAGILTAIYTAQKIRKNKNQ